MYRFIAFELLFAAAAMALFYYQIWGIFGIDKVISSTKFSVFTCLELWKCISRDEK